MATQLIFSWILDEFPPRQIPNLWIALNTTMRELWRVSDSETIFSDELRLTQVHRIELCAILLHHDLLSCQYCSRLFSVISCILILVD